MPEAPVLQWALFSLGSWQVTLLLIGLYACIWFPHQVTIMKSNLQKLDEQKQSAVYIDDSVDKKKKRQKKGMRKIYLLKTSLESRDYK